MRHIARRLLCASLLVLCVPALAQTMGDAGKSSAQKLHDLGLAGSNVQAPGLGRVIVVFLLMAAAAWAVIWLIRRYGLRLGAGVVSGTTPIRQLARTSLPGGVHCHVIETQGRQVLITVTRNGVSSLALAEPAATSASAPQPTVSP